MASYDPRLAAAGMDYSQEQLYSDYLRSTIASFDAYADTGTTPQPQYRVNYADPQSGLAPGFRRPSDLFQLDPDPFGTQTASIGAGIPTSGVSGDSVLALDVFGKRMTREQLQQSDSGRRLLEISERARTGRRRGFLEAITDWSWSDAPFLSLFATVGKSVSDAVTVSDTFRKLQNGEPVTDDELIKTRLYMAEQQERENGTWGATVGDIVRAAPGFMVEFLASGGALSLARTGLAKMGSAGIHLAMNRANKTLAREATEIAAKSVISLEKLGAGAGGWRALAGSDKARTSVVDKAVETVMDTMYKGKAGVNRVLGGALTEDGMVKFADDAAVRGMVRNRVEYELGKTLARNSSEHGVVNWMHSTGQWLGRHLSSGLLDHGSWATEEATVLTNSFTKARSALADAVGAMFVEAPIRGSLQFGINSLVAKPLLGAAFTDDGRTVSEAQLSLQQSAYLQGLKDPEAGRRLMEDADSISAGMNWLEYVSENAGRGFGSLARGIGLWIDRGLKPAVRGIVKPAAETAVADAAEISGAESGFRLGGVLRDFFTKRFGTRADFLRKSLDDKVAVVGRAFAEEGISVDGAALRQALMNRSMDSLPAAAVDFIDRSLGKTVSRTASGRTVTAIGKVAGANFDTFVNNVMEAAYKSGEQNLAYKTFGRYMVADWMTRHNIGPETLLNLYQKMGYDGVLGEMLEERYSDMAKGFFGWNDRADRQEVLTRLSEGFKGIWPGWDQLTAEAVGFAMPMVTRMGVARIQSRLGGEGALAKLRERLEYFADIFRSPTTGRWRIGEYLDVHAMSLAADRKAVRDAEAELRSAQESGDEQAQAAAEEKVKSAVGVRDRREANHVKWLAGLREANAVRLNGAIEAARKSGNEEEAVRLEGERDRLANVYSGWERGEATPEGMARADLDAMVVVEPLSQAEAGGEGFSMRPVAESEQSARAMDAYESFVSFTPELAKMVWQLDAPLDGEAPSMLRRVAQRLVGIAGFAITGDLSLTSADPASWVARDMGVDREFLKSIKSVFGSARKDAQRALLDEKAERARIAVMEARAKGEPTSVTSGETFDVTEREIDERAQEIVAPQLRRMAQAYLAAQQVRSFSRNEMRDQALMLVARTPRADGGAYDVVDPAKRELYRLNADGSIDESSRIGFDEFYEANKEDAKTGAVTRKGVDSTTVDIARATLDLLANRSGVSLSARGASAQVVEMPDSAEWRKLAVYNAAMELSGFRGMISTKQLRKDRTLEQTMRDSAHSRVSSAVMKAVARQAMNPDGTYDPSKVDTRLLETVAQGLGLQFDGTEKGLAKRNAKAVELSIYTASMDDPNVRFFAVYGEEDVENERVRDGAVVYLRAAFRDGKWVCSSEFTPVQAKDGSTSDVKTYESQTLGGLLRKLKADNLNAQAVDPHVVFTQASILETDDAATMIRALGLTRRYMAMMDDAGDPRFVHPLYRRAKGSDGKDGWAFSEADAERELEREVELASRFDGKVLTHPSRDGLTPAEFKAEEDRARAAWEQVYGSKGYITVAERLLRSVNVDTANILNFVTGFSRATGKYKVHLSQFMGRTGDMYVPIDLNNAADPGEAMVEARLMQGWATNPRLVANAFNSGVETFMKELDALAATELARARRDGNDRLVEALRDFRSTVTSKAARMVRREDGTQEVASGYGLSPNAFVQAAHAFCCFGCERLERDGYGRMSRVVALKALKDGARQLPHFYSFLSLTDLLLGGSGFLGERARPSDGTAATHLGLAGLLRTYFNEPNAMQDLVAKMTPGGVDVGAFLEQADAELARTGTTKIAVNYSGVPSGRGERRAPRTMDELGQLYRTLRAESGAKDNKEFAGFVGKIARLAGLATGKQPGRLDETIGLIDKINAKHKSLAGFMSSYAKLEQDVKDSTEKINEKKREIVRLKASMPQPEAPGYAKVQTDLAHIMDELSELAKRKSEAQSRMNRDLGPAILRLNSAIGELRAALEGGATQPEAEVPAPGVGAQPNVEEPVNRDAVDMDETDDENFMIDAGGARPLPEILPNAMYAGTDTIANAVKSSGGELLVGTNLSEKEARAAFAVVVSAVSASGDVSRGAIEAAVAKMFPGLPTFDRLQIVSCYDSMLAANRTSAVDWAGIVVREGLSWTFDQEDKDENEGADTASEDRRMDRNAVNELTGEGLRMFLKLARFASPETGTNLQAFLDGMRELVGQVENPEGSDLFLRNLLCPRERTMNAAGADGAVKDALDTYNRRDAMFDHDVIQVLGNPAQTAGLIADQWSKGHRGAFLLSYLSAMSEADRSRFAQLIGSASGCDAVRLTGSVMDDAAPPSKRISQTSAAAILTPFVGMRHNGSGSVEQVAGALRKAGFSYTVTHDDSALAGLKPLSEGTDALEVFDHNRKVIGKLLAGAMGRENPIVSALMSDSLMDHLRRHPKNVRALASSVSWTKMTFGGEHYEVPLVTTLQSAVDSLSRGTGTVGYEEAEAAAVAAVTTGDANKDLISLPERSSHYDNPLATLLSEQISSQPVTIMTAEVDRRRSNKDSSVAVTSRGTVPLVARWMDSEGFRTYVKAVLVSLNRPAEDADVDSAVARCRQTMKWPDGTRILAKSISVSFHCDEIYDACVRTMFDGKNGGRILVPVYAGDHASSIMVQVPTGLADTFVPGTAKAVEEAKKKAKKLKTAEKLLVYDEVYEPVATAVSRAIGLDLLGDDTKRSSYSSLEQAGLSTTGVKFDAEGNPIFGKTTLHITYSMTSRRNARLANLKALGNEEFKGLTMIFGYGAERQRRCAKMQGTGTLKCHLMSTSGRDLMFLKSLSVAPRADMGEFLETDYKSVLYRHIQKGLDPDIDTAVLTDLDSYKVGPAMSKWLRVDDGGVSKSIVEYIIDTIEADPDLWDDNGNFKAGFDVDGYFAGKDVKFTEADRSDGMQVPKKFTDVLPGLQIRAIEGLEGPTLDVSYREDGLTSYSVANVSHRSNPESLRTPRNHVVDMMAIAKVLRDGKHADPALLDDTMEFIQRWGLAVAAIQGNPEVISSLIETSPGLRELRDAGEPVDGQAMREELFRTVWARMRDNLNLPMNAIDCPLVSAGAGVSVLRDAAGNILYDEHGRPRVTMLSKSQMAKDLNLGSVLFTEDESKNLYNGFKRRLALAAVNVRNRSFRYGWWMDEAEFAKQFMGGVRSTDEEIMARLDQVMTDLHNRETAGGRKPDMDVRRKLAMCFRDHRGMKISDYGDRDVKAVMFDDLFLRSPDGRGRVFDRSAVQIDEDRVHLDADGKSEPHIFLGGTAFGLPRTPSYNGSMWLQVVRASVPVTEVAPADGKGRYLPGQDAMVAPDPVTNEILGCDHDGDKTKIYMMKGTSVAEFLDDIPVPEDTDAFGSSAEAREGHYRALKARGFVDETMDPRTGMKIRSLSDRVRLLAGNRTARDLFEMAHALPVPERRGDRIGPDEAGPRGPMRQSFLGGPASMPTRAFPGNKATRESLLNPEHPYERPGAAKTIGKGHRLDEAKLAASVSAKANDAADARARIVSIAKALHLAYVCGWYADGKGSLFGDGVDANSWMRFMYIVDGISNATFDDIKEQLCSRLGWTSGMMNAVVSDLLLNRNADGRYAGRVPVTDEEARVVLQRYVDSVNNYGSRYYMMVASDEADREGFTKAKESLTGGGRFSWASVFGLEKGSDGRFTETAGGTGAGLAVRSLVKDALELVNEGRNNDALKMDLQGAYKALAYSGRNASASHGYLFWLLKRVAGVKGTGDLAEIAKGVKGADVSVPGKGARRDALVNDLRDFLLWSEKSSWLENARLVGNTFNYLAADPGADSADNLATQLAEWSDRADRLSRSVHGKSDDPFMSTYKSMRATTRSIYGFGYGLETVAVRAGNAVRNFDMNLSGILASGWQDGTLVNTEAFANAVKGIMALDRMGEGAFDSMKREGNAQTIPFVVAALQSVTGKSPREVITMLRSIGGAYHPDPSKGAADGWTKGMWTGDAKRVLTDSGAIFRTLKGINSLFEVMYRLATTSTEHFDQTENGNSAFGYFQSRETDKFQTPDRDIDDSVFDEGPKRVYEDGGSRADPLYRIQPRFLGSTDLLADKAKVLVARIMDGRSFSGERRRRSGETKATSFALTRNNLALVRAELNLGNAETPSAKEFLRDIAAAERIVDAIGDITPQRMFTELLPLYTALTSRTTGAPVAGSGSLLSLLPGVYETWASRAVSNERIDRQLIDALIATNFAPVNKAKTVKRRAKDTVEGRDAYEGLTTGEVREVPGIETAAMRENPEFMNVVDLFAGGGALAEAAAYLMATVAPKPAPAASPAAQAGAGIADGGVKAEFDESKATPETRATANAMRALCGQWARVKITSETTLVIEGTVRGGLHKGSPAEAKAVLLVSTSGDGMAAVDDPAQVTALAGSRSFAASLVNQVGKDIGLGSVEDFFRLPLEVREALVKRYSIGGATLNRAIKTIDGRGMAVLTGAIKLGRGKADTKVYHEYFHGMMSIFRALGMFGEEDIKALRRTFGDPPAGSGMLFNEERAAERFRKYVESQTAEKDAAVRGIFQRIFDAIKLLFREIARGFRYGREGLAEGEGFSANERALFSFAIHGVAVRSLDRVAELDAMNAARSAGAAQAVSDGMGAARELVVRKHEDGKWYPELLAPGTKVDGVNVKWAPREAVEREAALRVNTALRNGRDVAGAFGEDASAPRRVEGTSGKKVRAVEAGAVANAVVALESGGDVSPYIAALVGSRDLSAQAEISLTPVPRLESVEDVSFAVNLGQAPIGTSHETWAAGRTLAEICAGRAVQEIGPEGVKALHRMDPSVYAKSLTPKTMSVLRGAIRDAMTVLGPEALAKAKPGKELVDNAAFEVALCLHKGLSSMLATDREAERRFTESLIASDDGRKALATVYDVSAAIMVSGGVHPADYIREARESLKSLAGRTGDRGKALVKACFDALGEAEAAVDDPSAFVGELSKATQVVADTLSRVKAGLVYTGFDAQGRPGEYAVANEGESANEQSNANYETYSILATAEPAERAVLQEALHATISTLFRTMASLKYHRELGYAPATAADLAMQRQVQEIVARHVTTEEWCRTHAIGNSNLVDNEGLVDYYDQPYFTADSMEQWLSAAVRPSFGGSPFGDAVRQQHHEYAGLIHELTDLENWQAFLLGDSVSAGSPLLAPILRERKFEMDAGTVRFRKTGDRLVGFDRYGNTTCSVALTADELAAVDWWKKSLVSYMAGQKRMVTGVDRIWFSEHENFAPGAWDRDSVRRKFDSLSSDDKLTRWEMTLRRMMWQLPEFVLSGENGGLGLYDRVVRSAGEALDAALARRRELHRKSTDGTLSPDERREFETFDINDRTLTKLEEDGFVVCRRKADGRAYEAVLVVDADEVDERFRGSTAYGKLVSDARWLRTGIGMEQRREIVSREALVKPYRELWGRVSRFVREHPWMTQGDARNMTAFGTPVPFFRGTGLFMHNAIRASRAGQARRSRVDALGRNERTFLWACTAENRGYRISDPAHTNDVLTLIDILHDVAGLGRLEGTGLRAALMNGDLQPGGKYAELAARRGLRLGKDPTVAEVSDAIYGYIVDRAYAEARGVAWNAREARTVDALVSIYEDRALGDGEFTGMMGVSPEAMYRGHGVLPANHQLGHLIRKAAEGVTNAMAHRATFMTLMTTPSADGMPVYYARPDDRAAERSGIPDECWGRIARWWAELHHLKYDETQTGVKNAQRIYDEIKNAGTDPSNRGGKAWRLKLGEGDHRYVPLADDHDLVSVTGIMCMDDEDLGEGSSALNAIAGGEAAGYMKQFVNAGRNLGFLGTRQAIHRALSWSKSMSVAFSLFFPLATRFESPIGAVGAIPTIVGNAGPGFLRDHPEIFNGLQKVFRGSGWITKDFLGFRDVLQMMDSRDPFLAEMVSWAHAIGITLSDSLVNPGEPDKAIVARDVAAMKRAVRDMVKSDKAAARFDSFVDSLVLRSGDKAFNYALNATKLAVVAQMAMKLRHEAKLRGKAFDPIRDLKKYAGYINAEVGGIDEARYAWAHPWMRGILNCLFFSWQWTRGAWEAGGGGVIEDVIFGGHTVSREERQHLMGRWARMYGEVMIGVPMLMQIVSLTLAKLMGGGGDDDDRWFTWQNEDKAYLSAFDITPLMKALHRHEDVAGIAGRVVGAGVGAAKFGALGAVGGLLLGDRLVPNYTGKDQANQTTRNRRYYMHFGKQGWEFFRWFDSPGQQFMGKLNMVGQRYLEGFFGRNLGYLERKLPWDGMGPAERWLNPTLDSATVNLVKAFLPFSVGQFMSFGDAGVLPVVGPVQMGASQTAIQKRLEEAIDAWARNDRTAYSWGVYRAPKKGKAKRLAGMFSDILEDARRNGLDPETQLSTALGTVARNYYGRLFSLLPDEPDGEYDVKAVEHVCRALNRILTRKASVLQSAEKRLEKQGRPLDRMDPAMRRRLRRIIERHLDDAFAGKMEPAAEPPTREEY